MGIDLFYVERLHLVEVDAPPLSAEDESARDRVWSPAVQGNPTLFDGPVVACARLGRIGPHALRLSWARVTYRHYALRRVPGATALPSLFVNVVQPTDDGRVLAARMSPSTAAPSRWQLPGGTVGPPQHGEVLDETALGGQAARELLEEMGIAKARAACTGGRRFTATSESAAGEEVAGAFVVLTLASLCWAFSRGVRHRLVHLPRCRRRVKSGPAAALGSRPPPVVWLVELGREEW
ncbi:NUDIX hydrolase [Streptomyces xantholiticus]